MNVEKINNVALYAKNWYRHSNDIFADLKKYVGLDHPDLPVAEMSLSELYELMCSDYIQWAESVTEDDNIGTDISNLPDAIKDGVLWEDDPYLKVMWSILSKYMVFIPDLSSGLKPPVYSDTKDILPQRELTPINPFAALNKEDATDKNFTKAAAKYFNQTHADVMKTCFLQALKEFDFDKTGHIISELDVRGMREPKHCAKRVERISYSLWNKARKEMAEHPEKKFFTLKEDCMAMLVRPQKMAVEIQFIPIWYSVNKDELKLPAKAADDNNVAHKHMFDYCADNIDKNKFAIVLKNVLDDDGVTDNESAETRINRLYTAARENFFNDDRSQNRTYGTGGLYVRKEDKALAVYYVAVRSSGLHENSLYNRDRDVRGRKD